MEGKNGISSSKQSSMNVGATMDLFQHRYYKINRTFMTLVGQWPYQNECIRFTVLSIMTFSGLTLAIPQTLAIIKYRNDWDTLMDCTAPLSFGIFCTAKILSSTVNSRKLLKLLNRIRTDWDLLARNHNADILHKYAKRGRTLTIFYAVAGYILITLFMFQPVIPKIIDIFLRNGTELAVLPVPLDYVIIDVQEYYFYIIGHLCVIVYLGFTIIVATDTMLMVYVHHGCGLFAALGHKLQHIGKRNRIACVFGEMETDFEQLTACIDRHNEAIEYAELIEASYSSCFFFVVGINIILISVTGYQIVTRTMRPQDTVRFVASNLNALGHLFIANYMGQLLMDHSNITTHILNSDWYKLPIRSQKLLICMIMRCNIPCKLTAGTISTVSIESFETVLKTSMSYLTVLRSV